MASAQWRVPDNLAKTACFRKPSVLSKGYWSSLSWKEILEHPGTLLQFQLGVVFFLHFLLYTLLKPLNLPSVVIQTSAGIILGACLGKNSALQQLILPDESDDVITVLVTIAYLLFIFSIAVKTDVGMIRKSGITAWAIGILSAVISVSFTWSASEPLDAHMLTPYGLSVPLDAFSLLQAITQFAVIVTFLIDLKILNSELGRLSSSAALINYCIGIMGQYVMACARMFNSFSKLYTLKSIFLSGCLLLLIVFLGRPTMKWIIKRTPEGEPVRETYSNTILAVAFVLAVLSDALGLEYRFGPFVLGLVVPAGPPLGSTLSKRLDTLTSRMFMPLLMTYAGYRAGLNLQFDVKICFAMCCIVFLNFLGKFAAIVLPARLYKMPYKDAFVVCLILCAKGNIEIALTVFSSRKPLMGGAYFTVSIILYLIIAVIIPRFVRRLYDPSRRYASYQRRNVLCTPKDAELRILTCIHRKDDALATIGLLETSNPTKISPISLYVLHLVELVGRATPLLMDHQQHEKVSSSYGSNVRHIIDFFNYYKDQHKESLNVQVFTAVSFHKFMHDDICSLAFDKITPLIVLPFHRKWNVKGQVILDDPTLRSINCQVLKKAPCSIGVLVDRCNSNGPSCVLSSKPLHHVAVLFLGGEDDREAVALGKRMARSPKVQLTIVRLIPMDGGSEDDWERMLNAEALKIAKFETSTSGNVIYKEEMVREGSDTVSIVRSMESKFELIIVGCCHRPSAITAGLAEWSEFPELGPVGDLLASSDIESTVSVLAVQQQKLKNN
ncbi:cation/H(+) antiporter 15-like [Malania oleifera]|uniref:cation/H(+) antiporter 15-like n=1 Tax=Malania oleifera TaxID=397392 RepID=UPI0025ADA720|nr:cation/H(+) antiporter 15-like [Malania oleifera]